MTTKDKLFKWIPAYKPSRWKTAYWDRVTSGGYTAEEKENGWRLQIISQPNDMANVFSSSGARMFQMEGIVQQFIHKLPHGTTLDTEAVVVHPEYCNCLRAESGRPVGFDATSHFLANHPEGIEFRAFDVLRFGGRSIMEHPLFARQTILGDLLNDVDSTILQPVKSIPGDSAYLHYWIDKLQASGAEGVVFKKLTSTYKPGRRTVDWLKKKWAMITYDVVLTDVLEPSEKMHQDHRRFAYGWSDGLSVGVAPFTCHKDSAFSYIGRVLEIKGDELMPSGVVLYPRFVKFRDDKSAEDCIQGEYR